MLAFSPLAIQRAPAQMPELKRPSNDNEQKPPEPPKKKKVKGPRALGVLRLSNGKATLVPITILVEGKFYDASAYKADPVPMALEPGTVYEAERAGDSDGLFTIGSALHSKNPNTDPWIGSGTYLPPGAKLAEDTHKAEDRPAGIHKSAGDDDRPRLTRNPGASKTAAADKAAGKAADKPSDKPSSDKAPLDKASQDKAPPDKASQEKASSDKAGAPAGSSGGTSSEAPKTSSPPNDDPDRPTLSRKDPGTPDQGAKQSTAATPPAAPAPANSQSAPPAENFYRPTLRRGKPVQPAPDEMDTAASTPATPGAKTTASGAPIELIPAISDDGGPDPRSYQFFWKEGEEAERRTQMLALAADQVRAYIAARQKNLITAADPKSGTHAGSSVVAQKNAPASKPSSGASSAARKEKKIDPIFEDVSFRAYDVWVNNQPVMILTAQAHMPPAPKATTTPEIYSVTLVARTDIYGELRKLYAGVTDKFHLDVTPQLELIDAVDVDGDGRGELLFRQTADLGTGYIVYRPTGDTLYKMCDSLNAK